MVMPMPVGLGGVKEVSVAADACREEPEGGINVGPPQPAGRAEHGAWLDNLLRARTRSWLAGGGWASKCVRDVAAYQCQ